MRTVPRASNISQPKVYAINTPPIEQNAAARRAQEQLRKFLDRAQYAEARELFSEMIKTAVYPIEDIWKVGVEIVSKTTPNDLTDYLKAVYIGSPEKLAPTTFNAYIDQLMISEKWDLAFEEMELLYPRHVFHHPILLRKLAICAYHQWEIAKQKLPETYFQDDEHDVYDFNVSTYEKRVRSANKYLPEAHKVYSLDVTVLNMYLTFLDTVNVSSKKRVITKSLQALRENPDYFMLSYLLELNHDDQYFKSKPFILHLYECNPSLKPDERLKQYLVKTCRRIKHLKKQTTTKIDELLKLESKSQRICRIFIAQLENNNTEIWFVKLIEKNIFQRAISQEICDIYRSSPAEQLLKSSHDKELKALAKAINFDIEKYMQRAIKNLPDESDEEKEDDGKEEVGNQDDMILVQGEAQDMENSCDTVGSSDYKEEAYMVSDGTKQNETNMEDMKEQDVEFQQDYKEKSADAQEESEEEQYIPAHTELSLFQKYLQHPLFNDD
ncbi:uncharacterized protein ATC70_000721 [Mucor velutinosus]|uniref:Uncharacterized protein n=1 Tax=Mucor velutinosus TaxID=708070 RepID=A0AAN7I1R2_9FUNG|nr:hypothetical protein ATC70_000721 [Mucor velutinosus]